MRPSASIALILLLVAIGASPGATAQEAAGSAPAGNVPAGAPELELGEEVADGAGEMAVGTIYARESFDDWTLRCVRAAEGPDPCHIYQLMQDDKGNAVSEISLFPLSADPLRAAGATVAVPLGTLLTEQLTISVDGGPAKRYPFSYCTVQGCYARIGLTEGDVEAFKHGASAVLQIVPLAAPDVRVKVTLSLKGFTRAYETVEREMAAAGGQ